VEPFSTLEYRAIPNFDHLLADAFPKAGVYAVGGSVRDAVLAELGKHQPQRPDFDYLVTGVPLDELLQQLAALGSAELVGASFGVIKFSRDGMTVDVALPRRERAVGPKHRDFEVESSPDIPLEEDLARRDFRMNMMARDVRTGRIVDPFGGRADLAAERLDVLREEAFEEDPLRILRGAQFAARFELTPSDRTLAAMRAAAERLRSVAPERVADELTKLLTLAPKPSIGFELLRDTGGLAQFMPELLEGWAVDQNQYHAYTVYYHSLRACDEAPQDLVLRLAALLHDVGKPRTKEGPHFYGHEKVGEEMARVLLERMRFSSNVVERVSRLVGLHMYTTVDEVSDAGIRRFIRRAGPANVDDLFALRHADIRATGLPPHDEDQNERFETRVKAALEAGHAISIAHLAIDGQDVIALMRELSLAPPDFRGDARVGELLRACLEKVLDDPAANTKRQLLEYAKQWLSGHSGPHNGTNGKK
jgi:putative nucleotidyltransferase with HDIG domain